MFNKVKKVPILEKWRNTFALICISNFCPMPGKRVLINIAIVWQRPRSKLLVESAA